MPELPAVVAWVDSVTQLVGILNITPDSFSDGGRYDVPEAAYRHAEQLIKDGAEVLDIGAESTRPGAAPLSAEEEWQRLGPVLPDIVRLAQQQHVLVSVDTRHAATAKAAILVGADWINDVSGGADDALLYHVAEAPEVRYVLMHSLGVPADKAVHLPEGCDPVVEVNDWFERQMTRLESIGIARERMILDPGIGFGKTATQSLTLLWHCPVLKRADIPLLFGHSRKSCFRLISEDLVRRDSLTLLASSYLMQQEVAYIRVHEIHAHATLRETLRLQR